GYVNMLPSKWELTCFVGTQGFYVCNPSTQELVKLPNPSFCDVKDGCAFGYIKERNDSKCPYYLRLWGVLIENSYYWVGYKDKYDNTKIGDIISFNLGKEEFSIVVLPEGRSYPAGVCFLVELKGLLYLIDSPEDESSMYIWVLKDSKNYVCAKEYNIDLRMFYLGLDFITPLDYREEKILMDAKFGSLEWYDVEKKCFKRIDNLTSGQWKWSVLYTDGLFSLGSRYLGTDNVFRCCLRFASPAVVLHPLLREPNNHRCRCHDCDRDLGMADEDDWIASQRNAMITQLRGQDEYDFHGLSVFLIPERKKKKMKRKTLKSSKSRAASPSSIAERTTLSNDVIMEIFSRLPQSHCAY
ncbi:hypothetical protein MTR67_030300, partial [Solanum verrucosum]